MIHLVIGQQGSGKTLMMVEVARKAYEKGKKIYSNVDLKFPYEKLDYNKIINCEYENGIVIIDEIHRLLPARGSMRKINIDIVDGFLSMVRKKNLEVYGSTQLEYKVDIRFRDEWDFRYYCKKYTINDKELVPILHNQNLKKNIPIVIQIIVTERFTGEELTFNLNANHLFKLYDTSQIIKIIGIKN